MRALSLIPRLLAVFLLCVASVSWASEDTWRRVDPDNILLVETDRGEFIIELAVEFAPKHAAHMKRLARSGFFNGQEFYRVIENFVAQTGSGADMLAGGNTDTENFVDAEFTVPGGPNLPFTSSGNGDGYAVETGFVNGIPVGRDPASGETWILHCPGLVGMARNDAPDSGGTDWYIVIGQAPRHLDRNISMFGRVISGMVTVQSMPRGPLSAGGMIPDGEPRGRVDRMTVLSDMPAARQPVVEIMDTNTQAFQERLDGKRTRSHPWFVHTPPEIVDVCNVHVHTRISFPDSGTVEQGEQKEGSNS